MPTHHAPPPPGNDFLTDNDLGAVYSAIDDIVDNTIKKSAKSGRKSAELAKSDGSGSSITAQERRIERTDLPSVPAPQPPKPLPRNKSHTELKSQAGAPPAGGQGSSSREVKDHNSCVIFDGDKRVGVEELYKNYSKLQLEVQELKKELQSAIENEGKLNMYSYNELMNAIALISSTLNTIQNFWGYSTS